jgi:hypothetical protein
MDCDQVFMILTRGPFPTGASTDELVEEHLETCSDCWRLAEALRPALEVFQEAIPPVESRELPGYWGDARPATAVLARLTAESHRVAPALGARPAIRTQLDQQPVPVGMQFTTDVLPLLATVTALTAIVVGFVAWLFF